MHFTIFYTDNWSGDEGTTQYYGESIEQVQEFFAEDFGNTANIDYIVGE